MKALLIIDVQNDYFPGGNCELHEPEAALKAIKRLLEHFREKGLPVYYIQHIAAKDAAFFAPDTEGVKIHEGIHPLETEKVFSKHYPNSFYETGLLAGQTLEWLAQIDFDAVVSNLGCSTDFFR